ncbi:Hpt domain-containing protein [Mesonia algae]|uniref:Hpt domain-containing protein n=1 Tax=Mesonia algae TaxID=213248 RepID=A0A2W7HUZ7_9FLAO|nr:Hpt domain-containing protein [Mesonia algae]PZW37952.1 Hpt domain-containing protein [Mesonia algae]
MNESPTLTYINQLAGENLYFKSKLINVLKKELPEEIKQYRKHLNEGKYQLAADDVHKLKHKISILGLELSYQLTTDYEEELRNNNSFNNGNFEKVLVTMTKFINELK